MAGKVVAWTKAAVNQRRAILRYWTIRNGSNQYSKKLISDVADRLKVIARFPYSGMATDFESIRVSTMGNFSIYYKVFEEQVIVVSFWDNRQDPHDFRTFVKDNLSEE